MKHFNLYKGTIPKNGKKRKRKIRDKHIRDRTIKHAEKRDVLNDAITEIQNTNDNCSCSGIKKYSDCWQHNHRQNLVSNLQSLVQELEE